MSQEHEQKQFDIHYVEEWEERIYRVQKLVAVDPETGEPVKNSCHQTDIIIEQELKEIIDGGEIIDNKVDDLPDSHWIRKTDAYQSLLTIQNLIIENQKEQNEPAAPGM